MRRLTCVSVDKIDVLDQQNEVRATGWFHFEGSTGRYLGEEDIHIRVALPYRPEMTIGEINDGCMAKSATLMASLLAAIAGKSYAAVRALAENDGYDVQEGKEGSSNN